MVGMHGAQKYKEGRREQSSPISCPSVRTVLGDMNKPSLAWWTVQLAALKG